MSAIPTDDQGAKELFARYAAAYATADAGVADLYADAAVVRHVRHYDNGNSKTVSYSGPQYRKLLVKLNKINRRRQDFFEFKEVVYQIGEDGCWIKGQRFSKLKQKAYPFALYVRADQTGKTMIYQEKTEQALKSPAKGCLVLLFLLIIGGALTWWLLF